MSMKNILMRMENFSSIKAGGEYLDLGKEIGTFGYSVKKKTKKPQKRRKKKVER